MNKAFVIFICLLGFHASAMNTGQQIFRPDVQTLSVTNPNNFMAPPVLRMASNDRLNINFDIIGDEHEYLRYRIIHCNADWQPSRLMESEYLDGFNEMPIEDFAYSSNTYVHYVNYNISLPDPALPIKTSGNYLLQVFPESDPDDVLLQVRFAASEQSTAVNGDYTTRTDRGTNSEYQQLFFKIDLGNSGAVNPYQDILVEITQNNRPETTRIVTHPMRVESGVAVFEHDPHLIFEAGNEYRRFETVRTDYPGMHVDSVKFLDGIWHAWLQPDFSRKHKEYSFDSTQHGRFKIDEYNSTEPDLSADYVMVHFTLDPGEHQDGKIFIEGDFTHHRLSDNYLLRYDWNDGLYHVAVPLKQGSFNYQYTVLKDGDITPSPANIEGNKYETRNEYLIKVFLRTPGSRADRLTGTFTIE